jgi:urocanate hydratase
LGGMYFDFLLWLDRKLDNSAKKMTPKEMATAIRQYSLIGEGVKKIKNKVNTSLVDKSAEGYDEALSKIEDLTVLAKRPKDTIQSTYSEVMRKAVVKDGNKDIVTHTDRAKMIEGRIEDFKELRKQKDSRNMLREIRRLRKEEKVDIADNLEKEWKDKYGKRRRP